MNFYNVVLRGNFFNGRNYVFDTYPITVLAQSEVEAKEMTINNISVVVEYLKNRRTQSGRLIMRKSETYTPTVARASICHIYGLPTALFEGKFQKINLNDLYKARPELFI